MLNLNKIKKPRLTSRNISDLITIGAILFAIIALFFLIAYNVMPVKTADIKVPVATDKSSYYPGQQIGGIFFGEIFYDGEVRVLREVFCKNYRGIIQPPKENAVGDLFSTLSKPHKLEGESVNIGTLPKEIPIGLNCVLQFTNIYRIDTPFGERTEEYQYYTQNFAIISKERRDQLDCEATGKSTEECQQKGSVGDADRDDGKTTESNTQSIELQSSPDSGSMSESPQPNTTNNVDNSTTNNTTNNPPAQPTEPAPKPYEVCTVNLLGIKALCRTEYR